MARKKASPSKKLQQPQLLQAIVENPEDDTPRLVYADWLEENGDPERAEFIRVQCDLARLPRHDPAYPELLAREEELLAEHKKKWAEPMTPYCRKFTFDRGFPDHISLSLYGFDQHLNDILTVTPVSSMRLRACEKPYERVTDHAGFRHVRTLNLDQCKLSPPFFKILASSPNSSGLRELILANNNAKSKGLKYLLDSEHLSNLESLDLRGCKLKKDSFQVMADAPRFQQIRNIRVYTNYFLLDDAKTVANSQYAGNLREFHFDGQMVQVPEAALDTLAESAFLAGLEKLHLDCHGPMSSAFLAALGACERLTELRMPIYRLENDALEMFADEASFPQLRNLVIYLQNRKQVEFLLKTPVIRRLDKLTLANFHHLGNDLEQLTKAESLSGLKELHLMGGLSEQGLRAFGTSETLTSLQVSTFNIQRLFPDNVWIDFAQSAKLPKLHSLDVIQPLSNVAATAIRERFGPNSYPASRMRNVNYG